MRADALQPRVLAAARDAGVDDIVTETPERLDYLDALHVQTRADALLLLGSSEPHYTPSKVFPALLARRPLLAFYHAASSVLDVLRHPSVQARVFAFEDRNPLTARIDEMAAAFADLADAGQAAQRSSNGHGSNRPHATGTSLEAWSARALTGRLASVLDAVAAPARAHASAAPACAHASDAPVLSRDKSARQAV